VKSSSLVICMWYLLSKPRFDSRPGREFPCPWEGHLKLYLFLWPTAYQPVAQPDKRHTNRAASVLEWYDRHRV